MALVHYYGASQQSVLWKQACFVTADDGLCKDTG